MIVTEEGLPQTTKRRRLAQVVICSGCCCGRIDKGKPEIPIDWLKRTWKEKRLLKTVQLTISGCLGPCDIANVVTVISHGTQRWFGGITTNEPFEWLVTWAEEISQTSSYVDLPLELDVYEFQRFL